MANPIELWKSEKHPFEVWSDIEQHAAAETPAKQIPAEDLERIKWYGFFHRKRDHGGRYMNRIRVTGNELTAEQARETARIAYEFGHGIVDVTTRANLQVQGLEIQHLPQVMTRIQKTGLTSAQTGHDNIRNVFGHPFSGLMAHDLIDTRQLCRDIDSLYLGSREFSDLPRKLNICFSGTDSHAAHYWTQDLSFLAARNSDGEVGFQVLIGGTQGQNPRLAWHLPVFLYPAQVAPFTQAIIEMFRSHGSREKRNKARLRFLIEHMGIAGVLEWLESALPFTLEPSIAEPVPASTSEEFVGWFRQSDQRLWTMGLSVPLGRLTWQQLEGLAVLSRKWGDGGLRTTQEQGIAVTGIPSGFRSAAATDAAALGLSVHADEYELNTMACTGSQFCNIAVTETKGHMLQLIQKLRQRALKLHGIRIHMSGCPSTCAQHMTADIGLKGVRVRRLLGTREGFDVYLGGGIAGQVHLAMPYRLGVDVDQLPNLIEEVTQEFYLRHRPGQTFSSYWRDRLQAAEARKVDDADYCVPTWICDGCQHHHQGEDPPVFCPSCAGLRRLFARLEEDQSAVQRQSQTVTAETAEQGTDSITAKATARDDGFVRVASLAEIPADTGLQITLNDQEYALFRAADKVHCIDNSCPHEGAPLAEGSFLDGVVRCPWHDWGFRTCSGCGIDSPGQDVGSYETLLDGDDVFMRPVTGSRTLVNETSPATASAALPISTPPAATRRTAAVTAELPVVQVIDETPDVRTFCLDNSAAALPFEHAGRFVRIAGPPSESEVWKSFTVSSSPHRPEILEVTIKLNRAGQVTPWLFDHITAGDSLRVRGTQGGYFFDPQLHKEPLVLISAGSGITPMLSISRLAEQLQDPPPITFLYGSRTELDVIRHEECLERAARFDWFRYHVSLSQPGEQWTGGKGRISMQTVRQHVSGLSDCRYFLCGPTDFMAGIRDGLLAEGVPEQQIHTEEFHAAARIPAIMPG